MRKRPSKFETFWFPLGVIVVAVILFLWVAVRLIMHEPIIPETNAYSKGNESVTFDHSDCQYPNRLSNPPDGCDNSDPARPECMKIGTEDCSVPVEDVEPLPVTEEKPVSCSEVK